MKKTKQSSNTASKLPAQMEQEKMLLELYEKASELADQALYDYALDIAVHLTGSDIGFFHLVSDDQKTIQLTTWNNEARKTCTAGGQTHYPIEQAGNWVDCVRHKTPVVYNDYPRSPNQKGLPQGHTPLRRFMSIPVVEDGKVRFIFGVGNKTAAYDDRDVVRLQLVANELHKILKHRRFEQALQKSEEQYRAIADYTCDWENWVGPDGRLLWVNPAVEKFTGYTADEYRILPDRIRQVVFEDDLEFLLSHYERGLKQRLSGNDIEFRVRHKNGSLCWASLSYQPIYADNGDFLGIRSGIRDITDRKKAENLLSLSERRYHNLFETESDAIFVLDRATGQILEVNEAATALYGYSREQLLTLKNTDMSAEPDKTHEATSRGYTKVLLRWHRKKDGTVFPVEITGSSFEDQGRNVQVVAIRDITDRKKNEEKLRQSEEHFRGIFNNAPFGIFHSTPEGKFIDVNPAMAQMLGYDSPQELIETVNRSTIAQAIYADPDRRPTFVNEVVTSNRWRTYENRYRRKDGRIITALLSFRSFINPTTGQQNLEGFLEDITERKRAEMERETTIEFMRLVNNSADINALIKAATAFFQRQSGCEAVGVRLKQEDDYPYYETQGFSQEFVLAENNLCSTDDAGAIVRDRFGDPVIECMCGNVICGRFDPSKPFFTEKGSFWTNSTTELLATTSQADRQARTRNRCNGEGYESVALIPLHAGGERLGLLQLNDRRKGQFSPEIIALWERLADQLAIALAKFRAEEIVKEHQDELLAIYDNAPMPMLVLDGNCRICKVNRCAAEFVAASQDRFVGAACGMALNCTHKADDPKGCGFGPHCPQCTVRALTAETHSTGRNFDQVEAVLSLTINGRPQEFVFLLSTARLTISGQQRVLVVMQDITERKHAEEKLKKSEERYHSLFTSMGEGFALCEMIYDAAGKPIDYRHITANPAFSVLTGLPLEKVKSHTIRQLIPSLEPFWMETYARVIETGIPERLEHCAAALKKHYQAYAWKTGPKQFAVLFSDITEQIEAQQQAIRYEKELAHASRLSTIGEMASSLAHELNQPLCAILTHVEGCMGMLRSETDDREKLIAKMKTVAKQAEHAGRIINLTKDFARRETRPREKFDMNWLVHAIVEFVDVEARRLGVKVALDLDPAIPPIIGNVVQIEQVLLNLVKNGIEAMEKLQTSPLTLTITTALVNNKTIEVKVRDSGMGISAENMPKIFDSFFTTKPYGLGIGLSISRSIIESHGGRIFVSKDIDNGAEFCFNLPVVEEH